MTKRGLGRGLSSLIPSSEPHLKAEMIELSVSEIQPNPNQPRKNFSEKAIKELAESIKEHGLVQPIIVSQQGMGYELISGERRWRAAQEAGLKKIPAIIRKASKPESMEIALVENLQREDLNPLEEARAFEYLLDEFNMSQEELAIKIGKSRVAISNSLRLLHLPMPVQQYVENGDISAGHARAIMLLDEDGDQLKLAEKTAREGLSVRRVENIARLWKLASQNRVPKIFPTKDRTGFITQIMKVLQSPIRIIDGKRGGKIEIRFRSEEELTKIITQITKN